MNDAMTLFNERQHEIDFYYSVLLEMNANNTRIINTIDNRLFFKILKSNFLLMLYNIVEATITTGMLEIYECMKNDHCSYLLLTDALQRIWREYKIKEVYKSSSQLKAYTNRVENIIQNIIENTPLEFTKNMLDINGNLNAKRIKEICDKHCIRYEVIDDEQALESIRKKRNALAHGDESFSNCARDLTISDLEDIKDIVFHFLDGIITGMEKYCNDRQYLKHST